MSAHDTPEVGSGEMVGERAPFDGGRLSHDRTAHESAGSFWFAAGCPRCQRDTPPSLDLFTAPVDRQTREDWEHVVSSLRAALAIPSAAQGEESR